MKFIAIFLLAIEFIAGIVLGESPSPSKGIRNSTNQYRKALVDVKYHGREGKQDSGIDADYLGFVIDQLLGERGILSSYSNNADVDLIVVCRYNREFGKPAITPGFQLKITYIGSCSLKIVDKGTGITLVDKTYARKRGGGEVGDFIKSVFADWQSASASNTTAKAAEGMTNAVPVGIPAPPNWSDRSQVPPNDNINE
jgi:hypothetical protein